MKDFECLYNMLYGSFSSTRSNFSPKDQLNKIVDILRGELLRREINFELETSQDIPEVVSGDQLVFKLACMNLLLGATHGLKRATF